MLINQALPIILLPALAMGWIWGQFAGRRKYRRRTRQRALPREYFTGLNHLLNEQPDKAVDVFINLLEVDSDTVETHLALGSLFRRRGETDRAIRIHQNLIARPNLDKHQRTLALLALGQDYLRAGVLDRAERLFLEVVETGEQLVPSLRALLDIYQQEKDWDKAIKTAQQLERVSGESMRHVMAHHHCALAERAWLTGARDEAYRCLKQALNTNRQCIRANLLQAEMAAKQNSYKAAINYYRRAIEQNPDYISEALEPMIRCYQQLGQERQLLEYLYEQLEITPSISLVTAIAELLKQQQGLESAMVFIQQQLHLRPSLRGLRYLIEMQLSDAGSVEQSNLMILDELVNKLLAEKPIYRCQNCGFSAKSLDWQCPSCKQWETVKPIHGVEGE